jgi:hypothetical protein
VATTITKAFADLIKEKIESLYVGLIRQDGTECQGGGYTRQQVSFTQTSENYDYVYITNISPIVFPLATSDIAPADNPVVKVALYSGMNLVATIDLQQPIPYLLQDQFSIVINGLKFKIPKVNE